MKPDFRRTYFPYCLQRQADGRYAILNRDYKPIGFQTSKHVDYAAYPTLVQFKRLTKETAAALSARGDDNLEAIFLYNDGCVPTDSAAHWTAYAERLKRLAHLTIVPSAA